MAVDPVRDSAIDVLLRIFDKNVHIASAIDRALKRRAGNLSGRGRRFMTQLVYGTTRHTILADHVLAPLLHQPLEKLPLPIHLVLRMGVYQALFCNSVTFPAMVHTSVDLAKRRGHRGTAKLVNAVLKRVPERLDDLSLPDKESHLTEYLAMRHSLPLWLVERWCEEFGPQKAEEICATSNREAPRFLRVNTLLTTREALQASLLKSGFASRFHEHVPEALELPENPIPFSGKAFQQGLFFVQDPASMLPTHLLESEAGERVLDLCGAPGGKATHIAQYAQGKATVVCNDMEFGRMRLTQENVERLQMDHVQSVVSNAIHAPYRGGFDRVLLDAPCSGLGTLRRRPDIKLRISSKDFAEMALLQHALLRSAIELCKNGGVVVYSVCTFTPEETTQVIESLRGDHSVSFEDGPTWLDPWKISQGQYRVLPGQNAMDGYYLTRLRKAS